MDLETSLETIVPLLCVNCRWIATNRDRNAATYKCFAPHNCSTINLVDGSKIYETPFCTDHRTYTGDSSQFCGPQAAWYEDKPVLEPLPTTGASTSTSAASTNPDDPFYLPPLDNNALAAKLAAARSGSKQAQSQNKTKPATNLLEELGL
jgi:hypothetical protein